MRWLLMALVLLPSVASAGGYGYADIEVVQPALPAPPSPPATGLIVQRFYDEREGPGAKDPHLVGQDSGVGFSMWSVVTSELDAVRLRGTTAAGLAASVVEIAAGTHGVGVQYALDPALPLLETRLRSFWCDEPGDDDQSCQLVVDVALFEPAAVRAGWQDRFTVAFRNGERGDRESSYERALNQLCKQLMRAFERAHLAQLVAIHGANQQAGANRAEDTPLPVPKGGLIVRTHRDDPVDPTGYNHLPILEDRADILVFTRGDNAEPLSAEDLARRLRSKPLTDHVDAVTAYHESYREKGHAAAVGGGVLGALGAGFLITSGALTAASISAGGGTARTADQRLAGPGAGFGVGGAISLGISVPLLVGGLSRMAREQRALSGLNGGRLKYLGVAPLVVQEVRKHNDRKR